MFSDKNKIDETSGLSFIVICDNKIILFYHLWRTVANIAYTINKKGHRNTFYQDYVTKK